MYEAYLTIWVDPRSGLPVDLREQVDSRLVTTALPHGCDDHVWRAGRPVLRAGGAQGRTDVLGQERLPVQLQLAARARRGSREQLARRGHPCLGRPLCSPDAVKLQWRLRSAT